MGVKECMRNESQRRRKEVLGMMIVYYYWELENIDVALLLKSSVLGKNATTI